MTERWKEPLLGEVLNLKPYTYKRWEHYAGPVSGRCPRQPLPAEEGSLLGSSAPQVAASSRSGGKGAEP